MVGQKQAVVNAVVAALPGFTLGQDIATELLSKEQLEHIKASIGQMIASREVEYSKDCSNRAEVFAYARSMVMNHLKKAKELNGGKAYTPLKEVKENNDGRSRQSDSIDGIQNNPAKTIKGINVSRLPVELKEFVESL